VRRGTVGLALTALVAATAAGFATRSTGSGLTDAHPCVGAPGFTCSTLTVPLDRSGRTKGTLKLAVAVQDGDAPKGTLLFLTGGPGQPGLPYAARVAERLGAVTEGYRLVLFDQRGTGAGALRCPELQRQMGPSDLAVPTRGAVLGCAASIGSKRQFFGTDQTVEDIEALRNALDADRLVLDGVSYGTFVAERYALAYPKRTAKLVLDSVVTHDGAGALSVENAHAAGRVLRAVCGSSCTSDPAADLAAVLAKRPALALPLLDTLVTMSVAEPTFAGVPDALRAARGGSPAQLDAIVARYRPDPTTPAPAFSQGLHASALCLDTPFPWGGASTAVARRAPALRRAVARIPTRATWPFPRSIASGNGIVVTCRDWPPVAAPPARVPRRLPAIPVLLLNGDRDLSTPLAWAQQEARVAPNGRLVVVPGSGHSVQLRAANVAARAAVAEFLR
jgi:pimeloyl-ACP methyl ester carboxylesterase